MLGCLGFLDAFFVFPSVIDCFGLFKVVLGCFKLFLVVQVIFGRFVSQAVWGYVVSCFFVFTSARLQSKVSRRFLVVRVVVGFLGDLRCSTLFQFAKNCFHVVRRASGCLDRVRLFLGCSGVFSFQFFGLFTLFRLNQSL